MSSLYIYPCAALVKMSGVDWWGGAGGGGRVREGGTDGLVYQILSSLLFFYQVYYQ